MHVIGVAGTAKNSGKTTTTASLLNSWPSPRSLAITSIGYDGETRDNVTGLPKPRLNLAAGVLVVTAEHCVHAGSAQLSVLARTGEYTPLGELVVARVARPGLVVLAGPNNRRALLWFLQQLAGYGAKLILVDGALGRLAPLTAADGLVLATGAARNQDIGALTDETRAMAALLTMEERADLPQPLLNWHSLLVPGHANQLVQAGQDFASVCFAGVVDGTSLRLALQMFARRERPPLIVFADPVKLLLAGRPAEVEAILKGYCQTGGSVGVKKRLLLLAVTVNPFYPRYNQANGTFQPDWVDGEALLTAMKACLPVPVIDVVAQGGDALARNIGLDVGAGGRE